MVAKFRVRRARTVREVLEGLGLPAETIDEAERSIGHLKGLL